MADVVPQAVPMEVKRQDAVTNSRIASLLTQSAMTGTVIKLE